jgi:hypothetical protein
MTEPLHSTGRGGTISLQPPLGHLPTDYLLGAGNIGHDPTVYELLILTLIDVPVKLVWNLRRKTNTKPRYVDGEIIREGVIGESTKPEFSTGVTERSNLGYTYIQS